MYESSCDELLCEFDKGVLTLSFNRPAQDNLLNYAMLMALGDLLRQATTDDEVRVVVLKGEGSTFCGGDDWQDMGAWPEQFAHRKPGGSHGPAPLPEQYAVRALRDLMKPTVALLDGATLGLGLDMACLCDLRIATRQAEIGDSRVRQARAAATGISYLLPRLIGLSQANRILLLGDILSGEEAARIHLVQKVFPADSFASEADAVIDGIAKLPTRAYEVHKLQLLPQLDMNFDAAMTHCLGIRQTYIIEDRAEGGKAWLERRPPKFTGR